MNKILATASIYKILWHCPPSWASRDIKVQRQDCCFHCRRPVGGAGVGHPEGSDDWGLCRTLQPLSTAHIAMACGTSWVSTRLSSL